MHHKNVIGLTSSILILSLAACATPQVCEPIMVPYTVEVEKDRLIPITPGLVAPVEVVRLPDRIDAIALKAGYEACTVRTKQCNGQLKSIREIEVPE